MLVCFLLPLVTCLRGASPVQLHRRGKEALPRAMRPQPLTSCSRYRHHHDHHQRRRRCVRTPAPCDRIISAAVGEASHACDCICPSRARWQTRHLASGRELLKVVERNAPIAQRASTSVQPHSCADETEATHRPRSWPSCRIAGSSICVAVERASEQASKRASEQASYRDRSFQFEELSPVVATHGFPAWRS
jgi:hypothetical protein